MKIGTISKWNEEKGFGFITPNDGSRDVFMHINDYSRLHKKPIVGLDVNYSLDTDTKGRKCAVEIFPTSGHKNNGREIRQKIISICLVTSFGYIIFHLRNHNYIPKYVVWLYSVLSLFAFLAYAKDKFAAQSGKWRVQESTLHTISLLGGWPGAAIAQSFLRHKSKKLSFRITYWITVVINCAGLYWLVFQQGFFWLKSTLNNIIFG